MKNLVQIDLSYNMITDKGFTKLMHAFEALPKLERVVINTNPISKNHLTQAREKFPNIKFD